MSSTKHWINWGIIGCGDVCEIKSGPAFNKVNNSKLVAVMRRDGAKAEDYARRHGVPKFYSDATNLINDSDVNAIYIATPPSSHEMYTEQALRIGKPVYVEKPVSTDAPSCARMLAAEEKYGHKVSVAHYRRELPLFQKVKQLLQQRVIGNIRVVQLKTLQATSTKFSIQTHDNWRVIPEISGGGIFHDLSPHQLDIMLWLFGKPKFVSGFSLNQSKVYDAPDHTSLEALFAGDITLSGVWSFNVSKSVEEEQCEIIGDRGKLTFSFFKLGDLKVTTDAGTETIAMEYPVNIQLPMIDAVVKYFRGEGANPCSLADALEVMTMIDSVTRRIP